MMLMLWSILGALWLAAEGIPEYQTLGIFVVGTILMRSAGSIIDGILDQNLDKAAQTTNLRAPATKAPNLNAAVVLFVILCLSAFALVLFTNALTIGLAIVALLIGSTYPYSKRHTHLSQIVWSAAFCWGIPMAFAAQLGELPAALWLFYLAHLLWAVIYNTQRAMAERDKDLKKGIKSTALLLGDSGRLVLGSLQAICLLALVLAGQRFELGQPYNISLVIVAGLFYYHLQLIKQRTRQAYLKAFKHNNWVGLTVFLGIVVSYSAVSSG